MSANALNTLLDHPGLSEAKNLLRGRAESGFATGAAALDAALPWRGWPRRGLVEVFHAAHGVGELALFAPLFRTLLELERRIAVVAPPFLPYPPAVLSRGLLVEAASGADALWATETCLRDGDCGVVLNWPERPKKHALRRLQLAAEDGDGLAVLFRPLRESRHPSPAVLRLSIEPRADGGLTVDLLKCRARPPRRVALSARFFD